MIYRPRSHARQRASAHYHTLHANGLSKIPADLNGPVIATPQVRFSDSHVHWRLDEAQSIAGPRGDSPLVSRKGAV